MIATISVMQLQSQAARAELLTGHRDVIEFSLKMWSFALTADRRVGYRKGVEIDIEQLNITLAEYEPYVNGTTYTYM